ncbi:MAG: DUF502 domain-containing protein [Bacteroidota bacterium]
MNRFVKYFFQGLLYTIPISVTLYVIYEIIISIDTQVQPWLPFKTWGLGIIIVILLITVIGFIGNILVALPFVSYFENIFIKAPLVRIIYTSVKDLVSSFVGQKKSFSKPVLVRLYPESDIYRLGFLTDDNMQKFDLGDNMVSVYVPHSYAISGQLFIVDKKNLKTINVNATGIMKYIVSGGVTQMKDMEEIES